MFSIVKTQAQSLSAAWPTTHSLPAPQIPTIEAARQTLRFTRARLQLNGNAEKRSTEPSTSPALLPYINVAKTHSAGDLRACPNTSILQFGVLDHHRGARSPTIEQFELIELPPSAYTTAKAAEHSDSTRERKRQAKLCRLLLDEAEMKFSHSLQFNAVPDWSSHYIAYSNLKKLIYSLEREVHQRQRPGTAGTESQQDAESSPLLGGAQGEDVEKAFVGALDNELEKVCTFYQLKELEIYGELDSVLRDQAEYEAEQHTLEDEGDVHGGPPPSRRSGRPRSGSLFRSFNFGRRRKTSTLSSMREDEDSDEDDVRAPLTQAKSADARVGMDQSQEDFRSEYRSTRRRTASLAFDDYYDMSFSALYDSGITLKKRIISVYVSLCELRSFIQLNRTGFSKVLKKFDKILDRNLKSQYIDDHVLPAYPFQQSTMEHLNTNIGKMEHVYAELVTQGKEDEAKRELRLHLREHVVWERNTVWREMIGIERKAQAANLGIRQTMLGRETDPSKARLQGDEDEVTLSEIHTPFGTYRCPEWLISPSFYTLIVAIVIFFVLIFIPFMSDPAEQNCLALVVFVSLLWATEVSPRSASRNLHLIDPVSGNTVVRDFTPGPIPRRYPPCR